MMFLLGITLVLLGISLALLTSIGVAASGLSALPLAVWVIMLILAVVASFAGMFIATTN
tara:strand:- start:272 stop:448 length:177 start_codon:yes stop_codon:yes gene_type:complete